jgi:hypothetical protein
MKNMREKTQDLSKKLEREHEIYVDATDALTYCIIHARIPLSMDKGIHPLHYGKKYVSVPNENGNVLILPDPRVSDEYIVETWGMTESFDDFVKKALARILNDKGESDTGMRESCGSSCG